MATCGAVPEAGGLDIDISEDAFPFEDFVPKELGCFSMDKDRKPHINNRNKLRYLYTPPTGQGCEYKLRDGYNTFQKLDDDLEERLDNIMKWISKNKLEAKKYKDDFKLQSLNTDFVSCRGHFTKIMCTPYVKEEWKMAVTLFDGTYYISEVATEEKKAYEKNMTDKEKEMGYWGYKFEQYRTSQVDGQEPDTNLPVNNSEAFYTVVRTDLKNHSLLYSAEVDCCETSNPDLQPPFNYVEIKTNKIGRNKYKFVHPFKLLKWWAQSYLLGIPKIIAGFRSEDSIVQQADVKPYLTCNIPKIANETRKLWNPDGCMNFCDKFLKFVKDVVRRDDPKVVYIFERIKGSKTVTYKEGAAGDIFVPDWYEVKMNQNKDCV